MLYSQPIFGKNPYITLRTYLMLVFKQETIFNYNIELSPTLFNINDSFKNIIIVFVSFVLVLGYFVVFCDDSVVRNALDNSLSKFKEASINVSS